MQVQKRVRKQKKWLRMGMVVLTTIILFFAIYGIAKIFFPDKVLMAARSSEPNAQVSPQMGNEAMPNNSPITPIEAPDWVTKDYLTPNPNSRPQDPLMKLNGVVVHYVGNPSTSAKANRDYFEGLGTTGETQASSHFIIGLDGEIIQCIPLNEIAYCSNNRNDDTIAIECCHPDENGKFSDATYQSLIKLTKWLCDTYDLNTQTDVIRHYDVTGKICPKYYVDNEDAWYQFIADIK